MPKKKHKHRKNDEWKFPEECGREDWVDLLINSIGLLIFIVLGFILGVKL